MGATARVGDSFERTPMTARGRSDGAFTLVDWGLFTFVGVVFGSSFLFMEIGLTTLAPPVITLFRIVLGYLTLSLFPQVRAAKLSAADARRASALGIVWLAIPLLLLPTAQLWIDTSIAGIMNGAMPLFTVAWTAIIARSMPGRVQAAGLIIGFAGIVAVSLPEVPVGELRDVWGLVGTGFALIAAMMYGLAATLVTPLQQRYGSLVVLHRAQAAAILFVLPFAIWGLRTSSFAVPSALALLPLGIFGTGLAFIGMATLIGRVGAPRGSIAIYLVPIVAIVLGVTFLSEQVHPLAYLGVSLVVIGAWLTSRGEARS